MSFICLYDRQPSEKQSKEDIMLRAFGCKKSSTTLICQRCNNNLGSQVDKPFAESLSLVTTLVNPKHRRKAAPTQNKIFNENGKEFEIHPGGEVRIPKRALGPLSWEGSSQDLDRITQILQEKAAGQGIQGSINIEHRETEVGSFPAQFKIPVDKAFRSACKSAFEALALNCFDEEDRVSELLQDVRNFIYSGSAYNSVGWMIDSVRGQNAFAGCRHSLLLIQSEDRSVYWEYVVYGGIVAISGRFAPISKTFNPWLYEVEPLTGTAETETHPSIALPNELISWTWDDAIGIGRLKGKLPELNQFVNLRQTLGKHMEPLLTKVWKDRSEFSQAISKMTRDYVRETAQLTGKSEMEVMMGMVKLFPNGI